MSANDPKWKWVAQKERPPRGGLSETQLNRSQLRSESLPLPAPREETTDCKYQTRKTGTYNRTGDSVSRLNFTKYAVARSEQERVGTKRTPISMLTPTVRGL